MKFLGKIHLFFGEILEGDSIDITAQNLDGSYTTDKVDVSKGNDFNKARDKVDEQANAVPGLLSDELLFLYDSYNTFKSTIDGGTLTEEELTNLVRYNSYYWTSTRPRHIAARTKLQTISGLTENIQLNASANGARYISKRLGDLGYFGLDGVKIAETSVRDRNLLFAVSLFQKSCSTYAIEARKLYKKTDKQFVIDRIVGPATMTALSDPTNVCMFTAERIDDLKTCFANGVYDLKGLKSNVQSKIESKNLNPKLETTDVNLVPAQTEVTGLEAKPVSELTELVLSAADAKVSLVTAGTEKSELERRMITLRGRVTAQEKTTETMVKLAEENYKITKLTAVELKAATDEIAKLPSDKRQGFVARTVGLTVNKADVGPEPIDVNLAPAQKEVTELETKPVSELTELVLSAADAKVSLVTAGAEKSGLESKMTILREKVKTQEKTTETAVKLAEDNFAQTKLTAGELKAATDEIAKLPSDKRQLFTGRITGLSPNLEQITEEFITTPSNFPVETGLVESLEAKSPAQLTDKDIDAAWESVDAIDKGDLERINLRNRLALLKNIKDLERETQLCELRSKKEILYAQKLRGIMQRVKMLPADKQPLFLPRLTLLAAKSIDPLATSTSPVEYTKFNWDYGAAVGEIIYSPYDKANPNKTRIDMANLVNTNGVVNVFSGIQLEMGFIQASEYEGIKTGYEAFMKDFMTFYDAHKNDATIPYLANISRNKGADKESELKLLSCIIKFFQAHTQYPANPNGIYGKTLQGFTKYTSGGSNKVILDCTMYTMVASDILRQFGKSMTLNAYVPTSGDGSGHVNSSFDSNGGKQVVERTSTGSGGNGDKFDASRMSITSLYSSKNINSMLADILMESGMSSQMPIDYIDFQARMITEDNDDQYYNGKEFWKVYVGGLRNQLVPINNASVVGSYALSETDIALYKRVRGMYERYPDYTSKGYDNKADAAKFFQICYTIEGLDVGQTKQLGAKLSLLVARDVAKLS